MTAISFVFIGLLYLAVSVSPSIINSLLPEPGMCGISLADRIAGGKRTAVNAYPWTALIGQIIPRLPRTIDFICGGSLISNQFVLTAAHCFEDLNEHNIVVRLGEWDIESKVDCYRGICSENPVSFRIKHYLLHEDYFDPLALNDIALMKLPRTVSFTEFISPVCLPLSKDLQRYPEIGKVLTVIGWGATEKGNEKPFYGSRYKKETNMLVTNSERCTYDNRPLYISEICVENSTTNSLSCGGDSGGSVVAAENDGYWYQHGIVSHGSECGGRDKHPTDQYVRVSYYLTWIMKAMIQLNSGS